MKKHLAFDLEIAEELPDGAEDWKAHRPLGITCAGIETWNPMTHLSHITFQGIPAMSPRRCRLLADYLLARVASDYQIITWNGLGFDFDVLAEECQDDGYKRAVAKLALNHVDIGFQMVCEKGFMIGLEAAAKGQGLAGKMEGMTGALAPIMWKEGPESRATVLKYVTMDAEATGAVYRKVLEQGYLEWTSKAGKLNRWTLTHGLLTAREALALPLPKRAFWPREKFCAWALDTDGLPY